MTRLLLVLGLGLLLACSSSTEPGICTPTETRVAFDDFERANQVGLGSSPTGQQWVVSGVGYQSAQIEAGRFTDGPAVSTGNVVYAALFTSPRAQKIGGSFSFVPGPGGSETPIALISSSDPTLSLAHMLHLILSPTGWQITTWQPGAQNVPMAHFSKPYEGFSPALKADGTVYEIWMTIVGDSVHLDLPNGKSADVTDPLVPTVSGSQTIWELAYSTSSAQIPRWESVETFAIDACPKT